jgi:hypothetical protein
MLRKLLTLVALVVVGVSFGAGAASAGNCHGNGGRSGDGFSDGRLAN